MIKVDSKESAWNLANRLFPTDYALDEEISTKAGFNIYYSTVDVSAWISDLGDRLELNYSSGSFDNIWIETEQPKDTIAVVGMYVDRKIFGDVVIKEVKEVTYHKVQGITNGPLDDGRSGVTVHLSDDECASFGCENVAYIRFE